MNFIRPSAIAGLALLPLLASAAPREDYARQWPLTLARDAAGAYRVMLDETVYRRIESPALRDLVVIDGAGQAVPTAVFEPEQPLARSTRRLELPWFALPASAPAGPQGWSLKASTDPDGRLRSVDVRSRRPAEADPIPQTAMLVDLSRVREPVNALVMRWEPVEALDVGFRVEASDDLDTWQPIAARGRLVDLQREQRRLLHRRIDLFGVMPHYQRARYLRLTPDRADAPFRIIAVEAELASTAAQPPMQWVELPATPTTVDGRTVYEFDSNGPFPVRAADIVLPGSHAVRWRLESRASEDEPWRARLSDWVAFALDAGTRSQARAFGQTVRDRQWRLSADGAVPEAPRLRLGYRPEVVVFVAQGKPPYVLAAGSARTVREEAPLAELVEAVRKQRGRDWQPLPAYLGAPAVLAGDAALSPARNWKTWLLWGVLVLGAAVVAGFAVSLLRRPRLADDPA